MYRFFQDAFSCLPATPHGDCMTVRGPVLPHLAGQHGAGRGLPRLSQDAQCKGSSNADVGEQTKAG